MKTMQEKCNKKGCNKMITVDHYDFECDFLRQVAYCKKHEAEL